MASPFELLEAYVSIVDRGLDNIFTRVDQLRDRLNTVTSRQRTVNVRGGAELTRTTTQIARLRTELESITQSRARLPSGLTTGGAAVASSLRDASNEALTLQNRLAAVESLSLALTPAIGVYVARLRSAAVAAGLLATQTSVIEANTASANLAFLGMSTAATGASTATTAATGTMIAGLSGVTVAAGGSVAALLAIPATLAGIGTSLEIGLQRQRIAINALADSRVSGEQIFGDLESFARRTGIVIESLSEDAALLLALGATSASLPEELRAMTILTSVLNTDMSQLARAVADVRSAGTLQGQELLQLKNAKIPLDALAESIGLTRDELNGISFEEFRQGLLNLTAEGSKFSNAFEESLETVETKFDRIKITLKDVTREFSLIQPVDFGTDVALNQVTQLLGNVQVLRSAINLAFTQSTEGASFTFRPLLESLGVVTPGVDSLTQRMVDFTNAYQEFKQETEDPGTPPTQEFIDFFNDVAAKTETAAEKYERLKMLLNDSLETNFEFEPGQFDRISQFLEQQFLDNDPTARFAENLKDSLLTPLEEYEIQLQRIRDANQFLTPEQTNRAFAQAADDLERAKKNTDEYREAQKELREEQQELERIQQRVLQATIAVETPIEAFKRRIEELASLSGPDGITFETLERSVESAREQLQKAIVDARELNKVTQGQQASALVFGTAQEFNVRVTDAQTTKQTDLQEQLVDINLEANQIAADVLDATGNIEASLSDQDTLILKEVNIPGL